MMTPAGILYLIVQLVVLFDKLQRCLIISRSSGTDQSSSLEDHL